jgi:hypothetical protein
MIARTPVAEWMLKAILRNATKACAVVNVALAVGFAGYSPSADSRAPLLRAAISVAPRLSSTSLGRVLPGASVNAFENALGDSPMKFVHGDMKREDYYCDMDITISSDSHGRITAASFSGVN